MVPHHFSENFWTGWTKNVALDCHYSDLSFLNIIQYVVLPFFYNSLITKKKNTVKVCSILLLQDVSRYDNVELRSNLGVRQSKWKFILSERQ